MDLKTELANYKKIVEDELAKHVVKQDVPEKGLNASVEYSLMAGGKRLRPILMLKVYEMFSCDREKVMPYAVAMEMIHNFSLIHDDLPGIDNDDFRHGKPTNHKVYGEATAILAGDSLLNNAYKVLLKAEEKQMQALQEFSEAVDRMIIGEYVDTEFEGKAISEEYLDYIHTNKTAALLKASIRIGAIIAKAPEKDLENLTEYAEKIGLSFQIKDDILSEEGDEKKLGKPVGNDKEKQKCTYVTKFGLDGAKEKLEEKTKEAVEIAENYGERGEFLKQLAIFIKNREY